MIRTIVADGTTEVNLLKEMRGRAGEIDAKVTRRRHGDTRAGASGRRRGRFCAIPVSLTAFRLTRSKCPVPLCAQLMSTATKSLYRPCCARRKILPLSTSGKSSRGLSICSPPAYCWASGYGVCTASGAVWCRAALGGLPSSDTDERNSCKIAGVGEIVMSRPARPGRQTQSRYSHCGLDRGRGQGVPSRRRAGRGGARIRNGERAACGQDRWARAISMSQRPKSSCMGRLTST